MLRVLSISKQYGITVVWKKKDKKLLFGNIKTTATEQEKMLFYKELSQLDQQIVLDAPIFFKPATFAELRLAAKEAEKDRKFAETYDPPHEWVDPFTAAWDKFPYKA